MVSKLLRRIHLYLALFLTPWVLMYALSTFVMNHRDFFRGRPAPPPKWERVSEQVYDGLFPENADRFVMARQILLSLNLDGAHQPNLRDGKLVIQRMAAAQPMRLTYTQADRMLLVEKQIVDAPSFLKRMHRRRGFQHPYALEDAWAFSVDFFIAAMLFWAGSGVWMWWELKATRRYGALAAAAGLALFGFFLARL